MSVTRELTDFIARITYDDIPPEVIEVIKLSTLNLFGCCLGGLGMRDSRMHVEFAKEFGKHPQQATIFGDGGVVSAPYAAYANSNLAFSLEYEDLLHYVFHPGQATIPSAFAIGEHRQVSGKEYLTAVALGYEVGARIAVSIQPTVDRGKHVWGMPYHSFAAAVAAGKLMGLSSEQLDTAFGIAGTQALVPSSNKFVGRVAETRPIREIREACGSQCMGGVTAAIMSERGFRGGHGILDGDTGFWVMAGSDRCDFPRMRANLGRDWLSIDTQCKIHPSIGWNHPAYLATKQLVEESQLQPAEVQSIEISSFMAHFLADYSPQEPLDAMYSLPFTVCTALMNEDLVPSLYSEQKLRDPELKRLLAATKCRHDLEADRAMIEDHRMIQSVSLTLNNGHVLTRGAEFPRDTPRLSWAGVERKFHQLAGAAVTENQRRTISQMVRDLAEVDDVTALVKNLA
jgi:2-methylcitrate dehydratase PrpD